MNLVEVDLTNGAWTEVLAGQENLYFSIQGATNVFVHFNESGTPPPVEGSVQILIQSFSADWDFVFTSASAEQRVWVRSESPANSLKVLR